MYRRIGRSHAPSVTGKVILAFGVPMLLSVLVLAVSERMLSGIVGPDLTPGLGVVLAVIVVLLYGRIIRWVQCRPQSQ
jgi:hypothetical protein